MSRAKLPLVYIIWRSDIDMYYVNPGEWNRDIRKARRISRDVCDSVMKKLGRIADKLMRYSLYAA